MTASIPSFDLGGPLPHGRQAIEASAGTGKTHTLSTLAARYVAEGDVPIGELLIVTFTRAAAAELRDRVRARLVEFAEVLASESAPRDDLMAAVWSTDRAQRLRRVETAIAEFDAATITTIHGFAQQVISTLGSAVPTDPDAVLVDDTSVLISQVATDLLVTEAIAERHPSEEIPDRATLERAAGLALNNPDAVLVPGPEIAASAGDSPPPQIAADPEALAAWSDQRDAERRAARIRELVDAHVTEVGSRRRSAGTLSFDDLLLRLRNALTDPDAGPMATAVLRDRFRVALIDEFQDTDPVQWEIFRTVFAPSPGDAGDAGDGPTLVLVGDPKQAIYAFRGANVHTYLQAAHAADTALHGLDRNWRSDPAVLHATESLLNGVTFGADDIAFASVKAPDAHRHRRFTDRDGTALPALSIRIASGEGIPRSQKPPGLVTATAGEPAIFREMAGHIRDLLETAVIPDEQTDGATRPLRPDDVAMLIAANRQGPQIRNALLALGIPAVVSRGDNVLGSEASTHWHRLLHALARPADIRRARGATISWFFGWDAERAATASDAELSEVQELLRSWGDLLSRRGVAAFIGEVWARTGVAARVLAQADGDRSMTDLDHIAELLSIAGGRTTNPSSLLATFASLSGGNDDGDPEADLAARRVESESRAVQIMTTFVAKGLEYPVVCCPTLWSPPGARAKDNVWWDDEHDVRTIDLATGLAWGGAEAMADREALAAREAVGSNLRVLYVALTRARHHTAVWWLPTAKTWHTGLARVLFARRGGEIDPDQFAAAEVTPIDAEESLERLAPLVKAGDGTVEAVVVGDPGLQQRRWSGRTEPESTPLSVATLGRPLDRARARWSFTALTSHHGRGYDPQADALGDARSADEGDDDGAAEPTEDLAGEGTLPLGGIAGGAGFGTLVHEVLEHVDFAADDLESEVGRWVDDRLAWNSWPVDRDLLVHGLTQVVRTPLGPLFGGRALCDLRRADRLDELSFDLTLGEGGHRPTDADLGSLLLDHLADDPNRRWAESLARGPFATVLAGNLTGSIDLVARIDDEGTARYVVADYKTNRLAPRGATPTASMFQPDKLVAAMADHHYQLQALLYSVAVHRYLRWRLGDAYDPAVHLGGIGYLFVRGMVGPDTPNTEGVPNGLFEWRPPAALISDLSDLLDGSGGAR